MSNYRGGGYRDRERTGPYRDSYSDRERDRDWRDRERDRDGRRDSRYDDSRRRYDSHEGLERPLGDPYERNGDRRRPNRDYDRPPPRRFERDERDFDRPARYAPPASMYDDVPRGPRSTRRLSRSPSPPPGPRYDRDVRPPADYDNRQASRKRSVSPSSQSSSSRRPRSPSRRPVSPAPLDREKFGRIPATKSPLESGEERTDSPMTGQTSSSMNTGISSTSAMTIRGSAAASASNSASRPLDARSIAAQRASSKPPSQVGSSDEVPNATSSRRSSINAPPQPTTEPDRADPAAFREPPSRTNSPPPPQPPAAPAIPTGPKADRDGRQQSWQGGFYRGGGNFGRGRPSRGFGASSSGTGTYSGRPSQRDYRDKPVYSPSVYQDTRRSEQGARSPDAWQIEADPPAVPAKTDWSNDTPKKTEDQSTAWGESSKSPWQQEARSSPRDSKQGPWAGSSPGVQPNEKEAITGWGEQSPFANKRKEDLTGHNSPGASSWARRDSRSIVRPKGDTTSGTSPGHWGDQPGYSSTSQKSFEGKGTESTLAAEHGSAREMHRRNSGPSLAKPVKSHHPPGSHAARRELQEEEDRVKKAADEDLELLQKKPWIAHYREADKLREKREKELDAALLQYSTAARKALRDLEVLEGELSAVNLNRKLRKDHLDKYKETFMGGMSGYDTGDVTMI